MNTILIIEDDRIMRENMSELLELAGYSTEMAADGKEGLEKARKLYPDLIICDIKMPKLDGYGVLHMLSNDPRTATIPFIFITARHERTDRRKGMEMGADDYIGKPFEDTELIQAVETRLRKQAIREEELATSTKETTGFLEETHELMPVKEVIKNQQLKSFEPKELIYRVNDYPHYLHYLDKGRVKTYQLNEDGKELISNIYEAGDFFSYQPLLEDRIYMENAEALEACDIYLIPKEIFLNLIFSNRESAGQLIKLISKNLTEKEEELVAMAYDSVRKRLANKLLELTRHNDQASLSLLRSDLASLVGTTTETIVRTLTELKELGVLETKGQDIYLVNRKKLAEITKNW
jgi:CheY-like chemotaxis protein/CRP-like cAMP-binding protein